MPTKALPPAKSLSIRRRTEFAAVVERYMRIRRLVTVVLSGIAVSLVTAVTAAVLVSAIARPTENGEVADGWTDITAVSIGLALAVALAASYSIVLAQHRQLRRMRARISALEGRFGSVPANLLPEGIAKLESSSETERAAAIYLLGRVAAESQEDATAVQRILSTYLHSSATVNRESSDRAKGDVQAAISVLGELDKEVGLATDFRGLNLSMLDFSGARLEGSNLSGAILAHCNFRRTTLDGANLKRAVFYGADLFEASFKGAVLEESLLDKSDGGAADFSGALLRRTTIRNAFLVGAKFTGAFLGDADLSDCDLSHADFSGAFVGSVNFAGCNLAGAVFKGARFKDVMLEATNIHEARFVPANLLEAEGGLNRGPFSP